MSNSLSFATIAALLLGACVITDNDDDTAGESGQSTTPSTTQSTTATTTTAGTGESSGAATTEPADTGTTEPADTGTTAPADTGTGGGACGWGLTGQKEVEYGYICGGDGEDPSGLMSIDCPKGIELVEGGDCGGDMGLTGVGCCDGADVWFCADDGSGPALVMETC